MAIERSKSRCPVCRTPCHTCAKGRVVNVLLATLIKTYWPKQYAQRLEEGKQTIQSWKYKIPLFCFNEVLFPGQPYRLHFFEPRYKLMMERCLEGNREFGFFPSYSLTPGAGKFFNLSFTIPQSLMLYIVGTIAEVIECEFLADGRCLVLIEGRSRFRIQEHWVEESTEGLNYARIELFDDSEPEANDSIHETAQQVESRLTEYLGNLPVSKYSELIDFLGEIPSGQPKMLSMWVSSFLPASPSFKLELLSKTSTSQRLMEVLQSLILILQISSSHVNYLSSPDSPQ